MHLYMTEQQGIGLKPCAMLGLRTLGNNTSLVFPKKEGMLAV